MKISVLTEENYQLINIHNTSGHLLPDMTIFQEALNKIPPDSNNPCILTFDQPVKPDPAFLDVIENAVKLYAKNGNPLVIVFSNTGFIEQLEERDINFAPTFSEAVDMAFMIKLEQELGGDDSMEDE